MSKLLTTLIAAVFAVTTTGVFAQAPTKSAQDERVKSAPATTPKADAPKTEKKAKAKKSKSKSKTSKAKSDTMPKKDEKK